MTLVVVVPGERALRRIHHPSFRPVQSRSFSNDVKNRFLFSLSVVVVACA